MDYRLHVFRTSAAREDQIAAELWRLGCLGLEVKKDADPEHVRLEVYLHHLPSREAVFEWVDGTLLNAYRTSVSDFDAFRSRYRERLLDELEDLQPYPFAFPRILFWANR